MPIYLREELTLFAHKPLTLHIGTDTILGWGKVERHYEYEAAKVEGNRFQAYPALYTELLMTPLFACQWVYGMRVDYFNPIDKWSVDPRFNGACAVLPLTTIKAALGLFHQPPQLAEMDKQLGNPSLLPTAAIQYSIGAEQTLPGYDNLSFEAEFFYKDIQRIVVWSDDWVFTEAGSRTEGYVNRGTGRAFGMELRITHRPSNRFFGWLAYSLMKAERTDDAQGISGRFDNDQRHILTLLGSLTFRYGVTLGARFRLTSGNPYTPIQSVVYDVNWDVFVPVDGRTNSKEMPLFCQFDLRIDKKWQRRSVTWVVYLDIQNVTNHQNVNSYAYNRSFSERRSVHDLPIIPSLGLQVEYAK